MSAPFDQNPWQDPHGPRYGNAYENESSAAYYVNSYGQPQMPMPMPGYSATGYNNAWNTESNKTEQEPVPPSNFVPQDAYQYSGTAYGNQPQNTGGAYSHVSMNDIHQQESPKKANENTTMNTAGGRDDAYSKPPQLRFWLPLVAFLASIGHLGFAAGARPYSNENIPFSSPACFYYLFAVAVISIIYSGYQLLFYCYRVVSKKSRMNRLTMFSLDIILVIMWGVGLIVEAVKYKCWWGSRFCHFYNVSIFWGFLAFACYVFAAFWDIFGAL